MTSQEVVDTNRVEMVLNQPEVASGQSQHCTPQQPPQTAQ